MPLQLLPSEHVAQEVENARVVRLKSDDGSPAQNHATHFVARPLLFGARRDRPFPAALMRMWPISMGQQARER